MTHIFFFLDVGFSVRLRLGRHLEFFFLESYFLKVPPGKKIGTSLMRRKTKRVGQEFKSRTQG